MERYENDCVSCGADNCCVFVNSKAFGTCTATNAVKRMICFTTTGASCV